MFEPLSAATSRYPENPILVEVRRGRSVESVHRGTWALVDAEGELLAGAGSFEEPVFARSAIKALQALALLESGAAERFGVTGEEIALACASHDAEPRHVEVVRAWLARLGLGPDDLRCGAHAPGDRATRRAMAARGEEPSALHNNCSGKHAGFLCLARHLDAPPSSYLDPDGAVQRLVRASVAAMCDADREGGGELETAVDGCSAPTFRLSPRQLALGFARLANPAALAPARRAACGRILDAVAAEPVLVGGSHGRLCTDLVAATGGRLFAKIGAEAVYVIGVRGRGSGLALKIDDGGKRGLAVLVLALVEGLGLADAAELERLAAWREPVLRNWAGREVGRIEVLA